jgi:D-glycero-alpha-D-manno-heptose 1-phosphate guanylyltransferase
MQIDHAIVLAGGLGTRLRGAVPDLPKPMAPVAGRPFLEHLLDYWIAKGVGEFVISIGYKAETITSHFGERYKGARIRYAIEDHPMGTGGAMRLGSRTVPSLTPFLVMNGDTFLGVSLVDFVACHMARGGEVTLALAPNPGGGRFDLVEMADNSRIVSLKGRAQTTGDGWINGGLYLFQNARPLDDLGSGPCSFENEVLPSWIAAGRALFGSPTQGRFIDIGVPEDYLAAQALFLADYPMSGSHP